MCGLVGVLGHKKAPEIITKVLKRLEYRGYDSWGLYAEPSTQPQSMHVSRYIREVGPVKICRDCPDFTNGIGHSRWATHGVVCTDNAHPIFSPAHLFCVVHNGIYHSPSGDGETDTHRFAQNFEKLLQITKIRITKSNVHHILRALTGIASGSGDNVFLIMFPKIPNTLFCVCSGNAGVWISDSGIICSDLNSLGCTDSKQAFYYDSDVAFALQNDSGCLMLSQINPVDSWPIEYYPEHINVKWIDVPKDNFDEKTESYWMLKEIHEQGRYVEIDDYSVPYNRPIFIGCGSSYYAAKFAECYYKMRGLYANSEYASEVILNCFSGQPHIFISQSGETKDIYEKMLEVPNPILITNNSNSKCAKIAKSLYNIEAGPEYGVAATKTFFFTCLRLIDLPNACRKKLSVYVQEKIVDIEEKTRTLIDKLPEFDKCIFMGTDYTYPIAQEAALKMKEVCYIPSEGIPAAEIKHGPIALADTKTLCVYIGRYHVRASQNISEMRARGANVVMIDDFVSDFNLKSEALYALTSIIPCQLMTYFHALKLGLNPDLPRNLAKCVTV